MDLKSVFIYFEKPNMYYLQTEVDQTVLGVPRLFLDNPESYLYDENIGHCRFRNTKVCGQRLLANDRNISLPELLMTRIPFLEI